MRKPILVALAVSLGLIIMALVPAPVRAATRSTPVTVTNPLALSTDGNTVKAEQLGSWSFFLSGGTAAVTQSGTWNVGITGTPNVNVANTPSVTVSNTPSVNVANSPTVSISSTANTVKAPTQSNTIQFWTSDKVVSPGGVLTSPTFSCAGYKELRIVILSDRATSLVKAYVSFRSPNGTWVSMGGSNLGDPAVSITEHANFTGIGGTCILTIPVMSDNCYIFLQNGYSTDVTIRSCSWAYLVN